MSRAGYLGCLASVAIRKEFPSSTEEIFAEIPEEFLNQVQEGCHTEGRSTGLLGLLIRLRHSMKHVDPLRDMTPGQTTNNVVKDLIE